MTTKPYPHKRRLRLEDSPASSPNHLAADDAAALEQFCKDLHHNDMPLATWQHAFRALDLEIPIWIPSHDADHGCERQVNFCRTRQADGHGKPSREPASCLVRIPPGTKPGERLVIAGQGDQSAKECGDLIVVIQIKTAPKT